MIFDWSAATVKAQVRQQGSVTSTVELPSAASQHARARPWHGLERSERHGHRFSPAEASHGLAPSVSAAPALGAAPAIQLKRQFAHEPKDSSAQGTYGAGNWARDDIAHAVRRAVADLGEDASEADAQEAARQAFHQHAHKPEGHDLEFNGSQVFVTHQGNRVDRLGDLSHDQDASMFLTVPAHEDDQNTLHINRSDGQQYVRDANNHYTPRFQTRSITAADRDKLNARQDLEGEDPNSDRSPLAHVGGADTAYVSLTKGQDDVTNAQGRLFNAPKLDHSKTGRIEADLLQVPRQDVVDVSSSVGARSALRPDLGNAARDDWDNLWAKAGEQEAAVRNANFSAESHTQASQAKPNNHLTNQQWQGLLDVRRTNEVLTHGLPFAAVTRFFDHRKAKDNPEAPDEANPLPSAAANAQITANAERSAARTQAAEDVLAAHTADTQAALHPDLAAEIETGQRLINQRAAPHYLNDPDIQAGDRTRGQRLQVLNQLKRPAEDELEQIVNLHQNKLATGVHATPAHAVAAIRADRNAMLIDHFG